MATIYWTGAARDGNWNTVTNWSGGALPVNNDAVYVSRNAQSGMFLNLDRTGDTAGAGLDLDLFEIEEGFTFDIGTSDTNRLTLCADEIMDRGSGNVWFKSDDGSSSIDTDLITVRKPNADGLFSIADESGGSSNVAQLRVVGGRVKLHNRLTLPLVYLTPLPGNDSFTSLETDATLAPLSNVYVSGGVLRSRSGAASGALYIGGGTVILGSEDSNQIVAAIIQSHGFVEMAEGCDYVQVNSYIGLGGQLDGRVPTTYQSNITLYAGPAFSYELGPNWTATINTLGD